MRVLQACFLGVLLAACRGGASTARLVDVRPITITFGGRPIARLLASGSTESVGENPPGGAMSPGPTLHADGTIQLTKGGRAARVSRSGEIYVLSSPGTEALFARIVGNHLAIGSDRNGVHVDGDMMSFDNGRDDVGRIEGQVDDGMRRTALVMLAAFMLEKSIAP